MKSPVHSVRHLVQSHPPFCLNAGAVLCEEKSFKECSRNPPTLPCCPCHTFSFGCASSKTLLTWKVDGNPCSLCVILTMAVSMEFILFRYGCRLANKYYIREEYVGSNIVSEPIPKASRKQHHHSPCQDSMLTFLFTSQLF